MLYYQLLHLKLEAIFSFSIYLKYHNVQTKRPLTKVGQIKLQRKWIPCFTIHSSTLLPTITFRQFDSNKKFLFAEVNETKFLIKNLIRRYFKKYEMYNSSNKLGELLWKSPFTNYTLKIFYSTDKKKLWNYSEKEHKE